MSEFMQKRYSLIVNAPESHLFTNTMLQSMVCGPQLGGCFNIKMPYYQYRNFNYRYEDLTAILCL